MTDSEAREMARDLVRGSIIEDAAAQFIAQVLKEAHDSRIKPMRADIEALTAERDALAEKLGVVIAAFRVNMMRLRPDYTHEQFDAALAQITGETDDHTD